MGTATQINTFFSAKKTDLWAQKGTVKAVILFSSFDVAHIHEQCRDTLFTRILHIPLVK